MKCWKVFLVSCCWANFLAWQKLTNFQEFGIHEVKWTKHFSRVRKLNKSGWLAEVEIKPRGNVGHSTLQFSFNAHSVLKKNEECYKISTFDDCCWSHLFNGRLKHSSLSRKLHWAFMWSVQFCHSFVAASLIFKLLQDKPLFFYEVRQRISPRFSTFSLL